LDSSQKLRERCIGIFTLVRASLPPFTGCCGSPIKFAPQLHFRAFEFAFIPPDGRIFLFHSAPKKKYAVCEHKGVRRWSEYIRSKVREEVVDVVGMHTHRKKATYSMPRLDFLSSQRLGRTLASRLRARIMLDGGWYE
jgi:hypothetical protein